MKKSLLGTLATSLVGAAVAVGQPPAAPPSADDPAVTPAGASAPMIFPREGVPLFTEPSPFADPARDTKQCDDGLKDGGDGLQGRVWFSAEYLLWWVKDAPVPTPLVTTGPAASSGILGLPGTTVLFGGSDVSYGPLSGARWSVGFCDSSCECGLEFSAFYLPGRSTGFSANSNGAGSPVLARPFVNTTIPAEDALLIAFPGAFAGGVIVDSSINLWGAEVNFLRHKLTHNWIGDGKPGCLSVNVDGLAGFRYLNLNEALSIYQQSAVLPGGVTGFNGARITAPAGIAVSDRFDTSNNFYGGQVGLLTQVNRGRFFTSLATKIALGSTYQVSNVNGFTSVLGPSGPIATTPGGLLALPSNIGLHSRSVFSYVPEVGLNAGYEVTQHVRVFVGYTFLYWGDVLRPGDQMSRTVTKAAVPSSLTFGPVAGTPLPGAVTQPSNFWAQGFNAGIAVRF